MGSGPANAPWQKAPAKSKINKENQYVQKSYN